MSSDRGGGIGRPLKPPITTNQAVRSPMTPRLATTSPSTLSAAPRRSNTASSEPATVTPRVKQHAVRQDETPIKDALSNGNITPRSSARKSRVESPNLTPSQSGDSPNVLRPRATAPTNGTNTERSRGTAGSAAGVQSRTQANRPKSLISDSGRGTVRGRSPLMISPGSSALSYTAFEDSIDSRFFHASDVTKQDPAPPKTETKKASAFFYADGQREHAQPRAPSPVLSAVSEKRSSAQWNRSENASSMSKSPSVLSTGLSSISSVSPFFTKATSQQSTTRSPSPSKENIHLSYRKGASQIIGSRPSPIPTPRNSDGQSDSGMDRRGSLEPSVQLRTPHRKSPSLSSIDSGSSPQSRRRSATTIDPAPSPLSTETSAATGSRSMRSPTTRVPLLDTTAPASSVSSTANSSTSAAEPPMSPTKALSELAADARRERKVLDLEISNSSLLAINASLEREVRRQKTELKRFRRLSRAGRFSLGPQDRTARLSEGLSTLGEEDEADDDFSAFGMPSGFTDVLDDFSDDDESLASSNDRNGEPRSPRSRSSHEEDRLARDEKRLRMDLDRHKELLVQSQMMNQSLKRCVFTTDELIREGRKALDYHVRVSDVKLGGRILSGLDREEGEDTNAERDNEVENEDSFEGEAVSIEQAQGFLGLWTGLGGGASHEQSHEGSELGDRDSGIEVDKLLYSIATPKTATEATAERPGLRWAHSIS